MKNGLSDIFHRVASYRFEMAVPGQLSLILHRISLAAWVLLGWHVIGTIGFYLLDDKKNLSDALYMTIITITTVGYGEVVRIDGLGGAVVRRPDFNGRFRYSDVSFYQPLGILP